MSYVKLDSALFFKRAEKLFSAWEVGQYIADPESKLTV